MHEVERDAASQGNHLFDVMARSRSNTVQGSYRCTCSGQENQPRALGEVAALGLIAGLAQQLQVPRSVRATHSHRDDVVEL